MSQCGGGGVGGRGGCDEAGFPIGIQGLIIGEQRSFTCNNKLHRQKSVYYKT